MGTLIIHNSIERIAFSAECTLFNNCNFNVVYRYSLSVNLTLSITVYRMLREPRVMSMSQYSACVYCKTDQSEMGPAAMCILDTRNKAILVVIFSTAEKCVRQSHDDVNRGN